MNVGFLPSPPHVVERIRPSVDTFYFRLRNKRGIIPEMLTPTSLQRMSSNLSVSTYPQLRDHVENIFLRAQLQTDAVNIFAHWEVGRAINEHIKIQGGRAEYGEKSIAKLANDIGQSAPLLHQYAEFAAAFQDLEILYTCIKLASRRLKTSKVGAKEVELWSHFRALIPVPDEKLRYRLAKQAAGEGWTVDQVQEKIKQLVGSQQSAVSKKKPTADRLLPTGFLKPRLGKLHTYRVIRNQEFGLEDDGELRLDHGFRYFSKFSSLQDVTIEKNLKSGDIVHVENNRLVKSDRTDKDRYFYSAKVEKGIDGDTFWAVIDCGLGRETEQKLRLHNINAAEAGKYDAKKTTQFLKSLLPPGSRILLKTSKSPSHDRFVADIYLEWTEEEGRKWKKTEKEGRLNLKGFDPSSSLLFPLLPSSSSKYLFVNNLLLALGLVKRMEE